MENAGPAIVVYEKKGWSRWSSGIISGMIPWVVAGYVFFETSSFDSFMLPFALLFSCGFFMVEAGNFTSIMIADECLVISRLLKRKLIIPYRDIRCVRSWNHRGEWLRPFLRISFKDGRKKYQIDHQFSKSVLNDLFTQLDKQN